MAGSHYIGTFRISQSRFEPVNIKCWAEDRTTPLVLQSADDLEARFWITAGAAAALVITEVANVNGSVITRVTNGVPSTTPAQVIVLCSDVDLAALTADTEYNFELSFKDDSDGNKHKVICRGTAIIEGSPST